MKAKVFVSAVLYVHNEQDTIKEGLSQLNLILKNSFEYYEIILVNDASQDQTLERARQASSEISGDLIIVSLARKHGIEKAMMAGLVRSMGDFVFELETTRFEYPLDIIVELYQKALYDIVAASPAHGIPWTSKVFYNLVKKVSYLKLDLTTETARIVSRRALNAMLNLKEKVRYRKALYSFIGYSKTVLVYESQVGRSKKRSELNRANISTAFDVVVSFSNIGLKLSHYFSIIFLLFSLFMAGYAFFNYFFNKNIVEGWTTLMILISFGFTGLFFIVGMLGEYISRILVEIQDRPFYTTQSVEKANSKQAHVTEVKQEIAVRQEIAVSQERH
ncbi:glycosyltransferase [Paenibacillus sp. tmac-D7]|uniref:glycosyltransferase n=1 Tax=Paenibacillus sp. tmac-D7 TaxID=2591462 RepID=UPI00114225E7|nr:glycosyltransferase [Paenibacillus sp. tmac-D7]